MHEPSHLGRSLNLYQRDALWNVRDLRLFETVTPRELRKLKPLFQVRHCRQGEFLFRVGDAANLLYFVERGVIQVSSISSEGDEHILDIFKPGDVFGELFVSDEHHRTAAAQALSSGDGENVVRGGVQAGHADLPQRLSQLRTMPRRGPAPHAGEDGSSDAHGSRGPLVDLHAGPGRAVWHANERVLHVGTGQIHAKRFGPHGRARSNDGYVVHQSIPPLKHILGGQYRSIVLIHLARARAFLRKTGLTVT